jgi:hypothetical protein
MDYVWSFEDSDNYRIFHFSGNPVPAINNSVGEKFLLTSSLAGLGLSLSGPSVLLVDLSAKAAI